MSNQIIITDSQQVFQIDCNVDLVVPDDGTEYHSADLVWAGALNSVRKHAEGLVVPGKKYSVKVIAVIIELPDELEDTTKGLNEVSNTTR